MSKAVRYTRRAAKLMASLATLLACYIALIVAIVAGRMPSEGYWQRYAYVALVLATPIFQLVLIGAGTLRDIEHPRKAITLYAGAALCLVPIGVFIALA